MDERNPDSDPVVFEEEKAGGREFEKSANSVEYTSRDNNCVIAHGLFENTGKPGFVDENKVLEKPVGWQEALKIVIAISPEISCSSFRISTHDWINTRKYGVFLKGGEIKHAGLGDLHSISRSPNDRRIVDPIPLSPDLIRTTINKPETERNELVVCKPQVAGFFIAKTTGPNGEFFPVPKGLYEITRDLKMPVYFESDSEIYKAIYRFFVLDRDNQPVAEVNSEDSDMSRREMVTRFPEADHLEGSFHQGEKVTIEDIIGNGPIIPDDTLKELRNEALNYVRRLD